MQTPCSASVSRVSSDASLCAPSGSCKSWCNQPFAAYESQIDCGINCANACKGSWSSSVPVRFCNAAARAAIVYSLNGILLAACSALTFNNTSRLAPLNEFLYLQPSTHSSRFDNGKLPCAVVYLGCFDMSSHVLACATLRLHYHLKSPKPSEKHRCPHRSQKTRCTLPLQCLRRQRGRYCPV